MELSENLRNKIWRLPDGIPVNIGNMTIRLVDNKMLVTGWTSSLFFQNVTRTKAYEELIALKSDFSQLRAKYNELAQIPDWNNLDTEYHIAYDDGGKGAVGICSEINGELHWYI